MVNPIPRENSDSSAKSDRMSVPNYGSSADRVTEAGTSKVLGEVPIKVTKEVKYKQYSNGNRMTEDFGTDTEANEQTQDFDGVTTIKPQGEPAATYITTDFSKS